MDSGFYAACAGLRAQTQALEVAAHNLANLNTAGYASSQVDKRKVGKLALAIQVAFQEMDVFQASTTEVPIDVTDPMPFSKAQAIENTERTASLGRIASRPEGPLDSGVENGDLAQLEAELETALVSEIKRRKSPCAASPTV